MKAFHDVSFPARIAFGASGGPERRNEIVQLSSGKEHRNSRLRHSRRHYDVGTGLKSLQDMYEVVAFFEARRGSLHAFRFRDPLDGKSCAPFQAVSALDQIIGTGNGTTAPFPLTKTYGSGEDAYVRPIMRPIVSSLKVAVDGTEQTQEIQFTFDAVAGAIRFSAGNIPPMGSVVTAGFEFDIMVRFDMERISWNIESFKAGQIPSIPLVEVLS